MKTIRRLHGNSGKTIQQYITVLKNIVISSKIVNFEYNLICSNLLCGIQFTKLLRSELLRLKDLENIVKRKL